MASDAPVERTGTGAHYRYARHLHDMLDLWYARYPETRGLVLEYPAGLADDAIRAAGFQLQRTLIWMEAQGATF